MIEQGGRVHSGIHVGMEDGIRGIVATTPLKEGEELLFCPWKLVIGSASLQDQMNKDPGKMCHVVLDMAEEIRLGSNSLWFPYLDHIELPRLPAAWDAVALNELQGLGPTQDATCHLQWFQQECSRTSSREPSLDPATLRSLVAFISRASEVGMIPICDLLNHHNGQRNTKLVLHEDGVSLKVVGGDIAAGKQLYLSYGVKSAATMYRDYGFVEAWPIIYNFQDATSGDNFAFVVLAEDNNDYANNNAIAGAVAINPTSQFLKGLWHANMPLVEYQVTAQQHMESLALDELLRFAQAAQRRLQEFPTTWQQDAAILEDRTRQRNEILLAAGDANDDTAISNLQDMASAIQYRQAFKQALELAATTCESMAVAQRATTRSTTKQEL